MTLPVAPAAALARLPQYSADPVSAGSPYGLDGDGAEVNFPAACADVAAVGNYVGAAAAEVSTVADVVAASAAACADAETVAVTAAAEAVTAAAVVRSLPYARADGSAGHILTVSGAAIPYTRADGSTAHVPLT